MRDMFPGSVYEHMAHFESPGLQTNGAWIWGGAETCTNRRYVCMNRNKRCILAYLKHRVDEITNIRCMAEP